MAGVLRHIWELMVQNRKLTNTVSMDVSIVDGSGNQITSFGGTGGTSSADKAAFTAGTDLGTVAMGLYEASPSTLSDGQVGAVGLTNDRKLKISGSFSSAPITAATSTLSNVPDNASNVTVLAANAARLAFMLYNDSTSACFVKFGATASATSHYRRLLPKDSLSTKDVGVNYTGKIDAIWDTAPGGAMRVTELEA